MNNQIIQKSEQWYNTRRKMITASDVAAILGYNPYESKLSVLEKKVNNISRSNSATNHGNKFEPLAIKEYEKIKNTKITDIGLIIHNKYKWLGSSPDGFDEANNILLEIKCVYSRSVNTIPYWYYIQTQIQMETCNKEYCDFFQCKFNKTTEELEEYSLNRIKRNTVWFNNNINNLIIFYNDLTYSLKHNKINKKRKRFYSYINWEKYVNINNLNNYANNDPLIDYLEMYGDYTKKDKTNDFFNYINLQLDKFKENIFNRLSLSVIVCKTTQYKSYELYNDTLKHIENKVPIIIRPLLMDISTQTYSTPDIIIRNDYIKKMYGITHGDINKYSIINIRYKTLKFDEDNNVKSLPTELKIIFQQQNKILNKIQGTLQDSVFILGKREIIGLYKYDNSINEKGERGIKWLKELREYGHLWNIYNPTRWELYPNMCNKHDYGWITYKKELANMNNELTSIWRIGINKRKELHHSGIMKWNNLKQGDVNEHLYEIIKINKSRTIKVANIVNELPKKELTFYVDFETVCDLSVPDDANYSKSAIYIIGCGYEKNGQWEFKTFKINEFSKKEEKRIIMEWYKFMNSFKKEYNVYHWTHAEVTFLKKAIKRNKIRGLEIEFFDLYKYFIKHKIVVNGAFNYSLKSIAKALYNNALIDTSWETNDIDGLIASLYGWLELTENNPKYSKEIIHYNEIDCKVLFKIKQLICTYTTNN
tara:strand:+ start:15086 stop:17206 length:2121 start_codon:yes stop_codon:yes gene_type:complete